MRVEWSPRAVTTASRFLDDASGMRVVLAALDALAADPYPAESFNWGEMLRLRAGRSQRGLTANQMGVSPSRCRPAALLAGVVLLRLRDA